MDLTDAPSPLCLLEPPDAAFIDRVVTAARGYLGAHLAFLAEIVGEQKVIRHAAGPAEAMGMPVGSHFPLADTYCQRLLHGSIPEVIYDVRNDERARAIPMTQLIGIDAYMGVPVVMRDGRVLGTLCCINFSAEPERRDRDVAFMRFLAELVIAQLDEALRAQDRRQQRCETIHAVLRAGGPMMVYQPIVSLDTGEIVGAEALARFGAGAESAPDIWFREAWALGLGAELELSAVRMAIAGLALLPAGAFLSVNASPATLAHPGFADAIATVPPERLVVEITEHAVVDDYAPLIDAVARLREAGVRIAVDDVGAGYASLRHVLRVSPNIAKLDMSLTRLIDADAVKQALATGMVSFAASAGVSVVAEGIETAAEADALRALGVRFGQGYLFARPGALPLRI